MKDVYCLSEQAVQVLKEPGVKGSVMHVLGINDSRTIDKHMKNNFPNGPLMNYNVREAIRKAAPELQEKDVYHKLTSTEVTEIYKKQNKQKLINSKYNNLKRQDT